MKHDYYPIETLPSWIKLNGVSVNSIAFRKLQADDGTDKGSAIVATEVKASGNAASDAVESEVLLRVPSDLVLSFDFVEEYSKSDRQLREVLEAVGDFGRVGLFPHCTPISAEQIPCLWLLRVETDELVLILC